MAEEDNQSLHNKNNRVRTLRDHMNPIRTSATLCIVFPPDVSHFNFKLNIIQLLSLIDKAKTWLQNLRPGSIRAWDEMQQQFLKKFFPS